MIRGSLLFLSFLAGFFILAVLMEYIIHFGPVIRTILFFLFFLSASFLLIRLILTPLMQWMKIGKILSYDQAARIIGEHFMEIQDKLLNTLQLIDCQKTSGENTELLLASIDQKIDALKVFRFTMVINLRKNLRFLKFALPPLLLILLIAAFSPKIISEPAVRILKFSETFEVPAAFTIEVVNKNLKTMQQEDFEVKVKVQGEEIPAEIFIHSGGVTFKMKREKSTLFTHLFKSLQTNVKFRIVAGTITTQAYEIEVYPKPILLNFEMQLDFPAYLNRSREVVENAGDCVVPEGTQVTWNMYTKDVNRIYFRYNKERVSLENEENNHFTFSRKVPVSADYSISPVNSYTYLSDSLSFRITAVPDGYPSIVIVESLDSTLTTNVFFRGTIKDDYGFSKLLFFSGIGKDNDSVFNTQNKIVIPIDRSSNNQIFYFTFDLAQVNLAPGDNLIYYFEIWDNDGIRGPKATKSEMKFFKLPSLQTIEENTDKTGKLIQEDLENSIKESKSIKNSIDELNHRMIEQSNVSWQEKKKFGEIINSSEKIINRIEEIKKKNCENILNEEKFLETSDRILEKQRKLNELMEQLLSPEMKKMIEEMKELLNRVDKSKMNDLLEKMKMNNKELETQLDRNLELFKQLEFDRKLEQKVNEIRKLSQEQNILRRETQEQTMKKDFLTEKQELLNAKFDSLKNALQDLNEQSKKLENPVDLNKTSQKQDSIAKSMNNSKNMLEQGKMKDAEKSQKEAADKMEQLANAIENMQGDREEEQLEEDASNIRMILENLIRLSFDQEELLNQFKKISKNDPGFIALVNRQNDLKEKLKGVEDSLNAIARRQVVIQPIISRELSNISMNIGQALESLTNRNIPVAVSRQQYTMTAINNLAILLNESLQNMEEQRSMSMNSSGKKACKKPSSKGGKMSAKNIKDMQQKLGQQLNKMKEGLEKIKQQGKGSKIEQGSMSKELAKMAAQQEAIRNELQKYQEGLMNEGVKDGGNMNRTISEMEEAERDIINKRITQETILRQQRIVTRLLESERAEQTREKEEKRESIEAKSYQIGNPNSKSEYNKIKKGDQEMFQFVQPEVNRFYKNKISNYRIKIDR